MSVLPDCIVVAARSAVQSHGSGSVLSILEAIGRCHALKVESVKHGVFVKCLFTKESSTSPRIVPVYSRQELLAFRTDAVSNAGFQAEEVLSDSPFLPSDVNFIGPDVVRASIGCSSGASTPASLEFDKIFFFVFYSTGLLHSLWSNPVE